MTYGCLDREYWHYKTLRGFPRLIFQQGLWGLSLVYSKPFPGNEFSGSAAVKEWIQAGLLFWQRMRHPDGSVDEWYRHERSFCATAFTAAAMAETLLGMEKELDPAVHERLMESLEETVRWLTRHKNLEVANQMVAGLVAVEGLRRLTKAKRFDLLYEEWKGDLLRLQHPEGWFSEYGGADIGYSLLMLDLLAHLWVRTGDSDLERGIDHLLEFISYFVNPDGRVGGGYSHRLTRHCFPYGMERMAASGNLKAQQTLGGIRCAIERATAPLPETVDDTYATYFYLNSFCLTACADLGGPSPATLLSWEEPRKRFFQAAGLLVHETRVYRVVINTRSGGWEGSSSQGEPVGDSGYVVVTAEGERLSSQRAMGATEFHLSEPSPGKTRLDLTLRFAWLGPSVLPQGKFLLFHLWAHTATAIAPIGNWFNRWLRRGNVTGGVASGLSLKRTWFLKEGSVELVDEIRRPPGVRVKALHRALEPAGMYSPSSEFYTPSTLRLGRPGVTQEEADLLQRERVVRLQTSWAFPVPHEFQRI